MATLLRDATQARDGSLTGTRAAQMTGDAITVQGNQQTSNQPEWLRDADYGERGILDIAAAGDALFQEVIDTVIRVCHRRLIQAVAVLDFVPWEGDAYHLNRQTPGPNGKWVDDTSVECFDPEDPDCGTADYVKVSFPFKCMLVCGSVTRKVQRRANGFVDVFAAELTHAVQRAAFTLELAIFQGNFQGSEPLEFDGLFELVGVYNGSLAGQPTQVLIPGDATGNVNPLLSESGSLDTNLLTKCRQLLKRGGPRRVWFVSETGGRLINNLLVAQRQFILAPGQTDIKVAGGFIVSTYDNMPIIETDGIPDDMGWGLDGSGNPILTDLSGAVDEAATTAIIAADLDEVFIAELTPLTVEPLAQCTTQRRDFEAYWDGSLVLACPEGAAMIIGVLPDC